MNRNATSNIPGLMLLAVLAVVFAVGMSLSSAVSFATDESGDAAKSGSAVISGAYAPWDNMSSVSSLGSTELTLYRVGSFARDENGESNIELDDAFHYTLPDYKREDYAEGEEGDVAWISDWLDVAATISMKIEGDENLQTRLRVGRTKTGASTGDYSFEGLTKGVYLITGESSEITIDGKTGYWWPQAMLVQVLQDKTTANLKPGTGDLREFKVIKSWSGDDESMRPDSITVHVAYDGDEITGSPFVLNKENSWTAGWKAGRGQTDASKWSVTEELDPGTLDYTTLITTTDTGFVRTYNINNTYAPPERDKKLKLVKELPVFLEHGEGVSTSFTFEISGYLGSDRVYHRYAGVQFDQAGSQTREITEIPDGLTRLMVREVESANYTVQGSAEKEAQLDDDTYTVTFRNTYNDTTSFDGGVINKYKQTGGKYVFDFREGIVKK